MNRIALTLLAGVAVLGFASSTYAADLIINEPAPVVPGVVEASGNWDGLFIGGFAGYTAGTATETDDLDLTGWQIGAALGANYTVGNGIIVGVVGDLAWNDVSADDADQFDVNWTGSLRGRLGFDGGAFMPYLTAGLAVAGADIDGEDDTYFGWTAGAGVEFAVADNVSLDLQYRYTDYGNADFGGGTDVGLTTNAITAGINFKF